jgi:hypothetical protein
VPVVGHDWMLAAPVLVGGLIGSWPLTVLAEPFHAGTCTTRKQKGQDMFYAHADTGRGGGFFVAFAGPGGCLAETAKVQNASAG